MLGNLEISSSEQDAHHEVAKQFVARLIEYVPNCGLLDDLQDNIRDLIDNTIPTAIQDEDYSSAISYLMRLMELKNGVYLCVVDAEPRKLLIRDARNAHNQPTLGVEPYLMLGLNYIRGIKELLIAEGCIPHKAKKLTSILRLMASTYYLKTIHEDRESGYQKMTEFNSHLVQLLSETLDIPYTDALKRIDTAKEFANFLDESKDIVTLTTLKDSKGQAQIAFQGEIAQTHLTDELREEFKNRASKVWYKLQPKWQQQLIDHNLDTIMAGLTVTPTQMRTKIPGMRNAYRSVNGIISPDFKHSRISLDAFHAGTIIYVCENEEEALRITKLNARQLQQFAENKKVLGVILNTKIDPLTLSNKKTTAIQEAAIVKKSAIALDEIDGHFVNLPLNLFRRLASNNYEGIYSLLDYLHLYVVPELEKQCESEKNPFFTSPLFDKIAPYFTIERKDNINGLNDRLREINELKQAFTDLGPTKDKAIQNCEIIEIALKIISIMRDNPALVSDPSNKNLLLSYYTVILAYEMSRTLHLAAFFACASGKDRTGIAAFLVAIASFLKLLMGTFELNIPDLDIQELIDSNADALARSRHQAFMAGFQAALATYGIKLDSKGAIPTTKNEMSRILATLIEPYSALNKKPVVSNDGVSQWYYPLAVNDVDIQKEYITQALKRWRSQKQTQKLNTSKAHLVGHKVLDEKISTLDNLIAEVPKAKSMSELHQIFEDILLQKHDGITLKLFQAIQDNLLVLTKSAHDFDSGSEISESASAILDSEDNFDVTSPELYQSFTHKNSEAPSPNSPFSQSPSANPSSFFSNKDNGLLAQDDSDQDLRLRDLSSTNPSPQPRSATTSLLVEDSDTENNSL